MTLKLKTTLTGLLVAATLVPLAPAYVGAQVAMPSPAYVINEIQVTDPAGFATYATREGALIEKFGGTFLVRGGDVTGVAGAQPHRVAIYVFGSLAKARAWRDAPEQKALVEIRDRSSDFRSFIVEGCATCAPPAG